MQLPRAVRERTQVGTDEQASVSDQSSGSRLGRVRAVLAAVVAAVVAYVAVRRLRSSSDSDSDSSSIGADAIPSTDEVRETATELVPEEASKIPIGGPGEDEDESAEDEDEGEGGSDADETAEGETEPDEPAEETESESEPGRTTADDDGAGESETLQDDTDTVLSEVRSREEIAERAEADVQDEPTEPGEMAVDEDVVSDLVEEDLESDADTDEE